jgi:hypothetical protein
MSPIVFAKSARVFVVALGVAASSAHAADFDQTHALWNDVLKGYQTETGHMRYKALAADLKAKPDHALGKYLKDVDAVPKATYDGWPDNAKKAFLMNAYNAHTVKLIVDNYPVKSIKDLGSLFKSPWKKELFSMLDGKIKTLDGIEQDTLRPDFKDARIHAAVNCASISCPRLAPVAFTADTLDAQLDALMRGWLADPTRNRYEPAKGKLFLSKIFDWYDEDFERSYGSVAKAVAAFGPKEAVEALAKGGSIDYLDYDWNLNEAP